MFLLLLLIFNHCVALRAQPAIMTYFPPLAFDESRTNWYAKYLIAMDEPSLFQESKEKTVHSYRFLWLRSFDPAVAIRLTIDPEGTGLIEVKVFKENGDNAGRVIMNETVPVGKENVDQFLQQVIKSGFWELPTSEKENQSDDFITIHSDGAQWILEGAKSGDYHVVDRWSPKKGLYRSLCLRLVELAKLKVNKIY